MKMSKLKVFVTTLAFCAAGPAAAIPMLTLDAPASVSAGSNFDVTVGIAGLDPGTDLGAFSFDFYFTPADQTAWLPFNTSFGDQLGGAGDVVTGVTSSDVGFNSQKIEVYAVSLLPDLSWQADDFALMTFGMYAAYPPLPSNYTIGIEANNFVLSDAWGEQIFTANNQVGQFIVAVPEPATLALMTLGLLGLGVSVARRGRGSRRIECE